MLIMATMSISSPTAIPLNIDGPVTPSKSRHRRMPSRNPKAEELPQFSFNPGAEPVPTAIHSDENQPSSDEDGPSMKRSGPAPLPDFSFNPGADMPFDREPSPTHPVLQEMQLNQQRAVRSARPAPLPAFSFGSAVSSATPSPTRSTFGDQPTSAGHRRGGSEFVGGGKQGTQLVSTSPAKSEYRPPPVSGHPRTHKHRRSEAVSVSDIDTSDLIKMDAISKARASSQPATPQEPAFPTPRHSPPRHSISLSQSVPSSPHRRESSNFARPRVGFADRVEMIPRPLSLISSETEGSCSTIRGHSVSGSIISIASAVPGPPSAINSPTRLRTLEDSPTKPRPRTADPATLMASAIPRQNTEPVDLPKRPLSASGTPTVALSDGPPAKKKHFWFSPTPSDEATTPTQTAMPIPDAPALQAPSPDLSRPKTSPERSASLKKKRKYHTWTSGIFSRKTAKRHPKNVKRIPTPPALMRRPSDKINDIFDHDDTVVLREASPIAHRIRPKSTPTSLMMDPPPMQWTRPSDKVIDLDLAMTDVASETPVRTTGRLGKLHSSERRGQMDPFGTFHKRAESAPDMQPVNRASFNIHRMGSNTSLAEVVFDEEEEDNFLAGKAPEAVQDSPEPTPADENTSFGEGLGLALSTDDVVIVDAEGNFDPNRSSNSTIEPLPLEEDLKRPSTSPMYFSYSVPHSQYASSTEGRTTSASMISSPDAEHVSFDSFSRGPRYPGEPNPDFVLRASNEDLPSLSDSSSGALPRMSSSANTRSSVEQRAQSVCVPGTSRATQPAWKRASLASLNRLIPGSANGSKLKFETVPAEQQNIPDEKEKRRSHRLSKLMKFWRGKEKVNADD